MSDIKEIIELFDLENWIEEEGLDYKITSGRKGYQINLKQCPRCGGSDWKVYLNRENGLGNCFHGSCVGEPGFNKFSFVRHHTQLESKAVIEIIKSSLVQSGWRPKVDYIPQIIDNNFTPPEKVNVFDLPRNLKYLHNRGITKKSADFFKLGMCSVDSTYNYNDLGGQKMRQSYSKRIFIPIYNIDNEMVTFQGRDTTEIKIPKYLFPPMLPSTGQYLYNGNNVRGKKRLIMGEGVFDVIALHQALELNPVLSEYGAIGSFGISFSTSEEQQMGELKKLIDLGAEELMFMWDGSKQALKSAYTYALEIESRKDISVKVAQLPLNKDPNEVSAQVIYECINQAKPVSKMNMLKAISTF